MGGDRPSQSGPHTRSTHADTPNCTCKHVKITPESRSNTTRIRLITTRRDRTVSPRSYRGRSRLQGPLCARFDASSRRPYCVMRRQWAVFYPRSAAQTPPHPLMTPLPTRTNACNIRRQPPFEKHAAPTLSPIRQHRPPDRPGLQRQYRKTPPWMIWRV